MKKYYYIDYSGNIRSTFWTGDMNDLNNKYFGNMYLTYQEAKESKDRQEDEIMKSI